MTRDNLKVTVAMILTALLFCGVWIAGHLCGYFTYHDPKAAYKFLGTSVSLWVAQFLITYFYRKEFLFRDHGFDLILLSFFGFVTMVSQQQISNSDLPDVSIGENVTLIFLLIMLFGNGRKHKNNPAPSVWWRLTSYIFGVIAAELYIAISLYPHVAFPWKS